MATREVIPIVVNKTRTGTRKMSVQEFIKKGSCSTSEEPAKISLQLFRRVTERLYNADVELSTKTMYYKTWCLFNRFLLCFDDLPTSWEEKLVLFAAFNVEIGNAPATISSYMSGIRYMLRHDGIQVSNMSCKLASIIRACKVANDVVSVRRPIRKKLLKLVITAVEKRFLEKGQVFLSKLYKAMLVAGYYGYLRIGEMTKSKHNIAGRDMCIALNKNKAILLIRSSKTQKGGTIPTKVEIMPDVEDLGSRYSPVQILQEYCDIKNKRGVQGSKFFTLIDGSEVSSSMFRGVLRRALQDNNLEQHLYNSHSLRSGRATDRFKWGIHVEKIKREGRWASNAVYKYFK